MNDVEPGIREHVERIQAAGWTTWSSCEHEMYVVVALEAYDDVPRLLDSMRETGYPDCRVTFGGYGCSPGHINAQVFLGGHLKGDGRPIDHVLLKVPSSDPPLHFILEVRRYPESDDLDNAYFYDEHTCPTNWTGDIKAVVFDGDFDPHGFAQFVRRVPGDFCPDEAEDSDFMEMFPELVKGTGVQE